VERHAKQECGGMVDAFLCVGICCLADVKVLSSEIEKSDVNTGSNPVTPTKPILKQKRFIPISRDMEPFGL